MQAAQIWRSEDDMPNVLLPDINKAGTIKPIKGPATYQAQGCFKKSIMNTYFVVKNVDPFL